MDDQLPPDPEELELAALEAAESAAGATGADTVAGGQQELHLDTVTAAAALPAAPLPDTIMVPKARLDQALGRTRDLELENARLAGLAEGRKPQAADAQPQQKSDPAGDRLIAIETDKDALWDRYEKGEIGYAEMKKAERRLDTEAGQLRDAIVEQRRKPEAKPDLIVGDLRLQERTEELAQANEWFGDIPGKYVLESLVPMADQILSQRGIVVGNDAASAYNLRLATIEVAKATGAYRLFSPPQRWPENQGRAQGTAQPQPAAKQLTAAEIAAKRDLSARHPPDPTRIGTGLPGEAIHTKDVEKMSEDEIAQVGDAELEQLTASRA